MTPPASVVPAHEICGNATCIAWALELLLKVHGKIRPDEYPFQKGPSPESHGFGPKERALLRSGYGLDVTPWHKPDDFGSLKAEIEQRIKKGSFAIFTLPSYFALNFETNTMELACHGFTADMDDGTLVFLSKRYPDQRVIRMSVDDLAKAHHTWNLLSRALETLGRPEARGYLLNALFSSP